MHELFIIYKLFRHPEKCDDIELLKSTLYDYLKNKKKHDRLADSNLGVWMVQHNTEDINIMRQVVHKVVQDVIMDILYYEKIDYMCVANMLEGGQFKDAISYLFKNCFYFNSLPNQYTHYKKYGFHITKSKLIKTLEIMSIFSSDDEIKKHDEFYLYIDILKDQMNMLFNAIANRSSERIDERIYYNFNSFELDYFLPALEKHCE